MSSIPHTATSTPAVDSRYVRISDRAGVVHAGLVGPSIGQREAPAMSELISAAIQSTGSNLRVLVIDLTDVLIVSSVGLGMCIDLRNQAYAAGAKTVVFGLNSQLLALFKMMKVHKICTLAEDEKSLAKAIAA